VIPRTSPALAQPTTPALDLYSAMDELVRAQREAGAVLARHFEIPRANLGVIRLLSLCGPTQVADVAAKLRVDVSVASRQISHLVDAGYVRREVDDDDRRVRVLELSDKGRALIDEMTARFAELLDQVFVGWSAEELGEAASQVRRVAEAITTLHDGHFPVHEPLNEEGSN